MVHQSFIYKLNKQNKKIGYAFVVCFLIIQLQQLRITQFFFCIMQLTIQLRINKIISRLFIFAVMHLNNYIKMFQLSQCLTEINSKKYILLIAFALPLLFSHTHTWSFHKHFTVDQKEVDKQNLLKFSVVIVLEKVSFDLNEHKVKT